MEWQKPHALLGEWDHRAGPGPPLLPPSGCIVGPKGQSHSLSSSRRRGTQHISSYSRKKFLGNWVRSSQKSLHTQPVKHIPAKVHQILQPTSMMCSHIQILSPQGQVPTCSTVKGDNFLPRGKMRLQQTLSNRKPPYLQGSVATVVCSSNVSSLCSKAEAVPG